MALVQTKQRKQTESSYKSRRRRVWNQGVSLVWNHHEVMYGINPKDRCTLTRDNQAKRVDKLACQRASADCSASVPSKTEQSTKSAAVQAASEQGVCHTVAKRRIPCTALRAVMPYQSFGLDKNKALLSKCFIFWLPLLG